jgi:tripartite-type tricarboxylate transporter receptor subunit TctC
VPALAERLPGFSTGSWMGMVAPLGTPVEIVQRVHAALAVALRDPEVRQKLAAQKFDIVGSSPEAFGRFVIDEHDKWAKVIRAQGISAE